MAVIVWALSVESGGSGSDIPLLTALGGSKTIVFAHESADRSRDAPNLISARTPGDRSRLRPA